MRIVRDGETAPVEAQDPSEATEKLLDEAAQRAAARATLPDLEGLAAPDGATIKDASFLTLHNSIVNSIRAPLNWLNRHMAAAHMDGSQDPNNAIDHVKVLAKFCREHSEHAAAVVLLCIYLASGTTRCQTQRPKEEQPAEPPPFDGPVKTVQVTLTKQVEHGGVTMDAGRVFTAMQAEDGRIATLWPNNTWIVFDPSCIELHDPAQPTMPAPV